MNAQPQPHRGAIILTLAVILLSACSTALTATPLEKHSSPTQAPSVHTATLQPGLTPRSTNTLAALAPTLGGRPTLTPVLVDPDNPTRTRYTLTVAFDFAYQSLDVIQKVDYVNTTQDELDELVLVVAPRRWPSAFDLHDLTWEDGQPISGHTLHGLQLEIPLPETLSREAVVTFTLAYSLKLPERQGTFGYTDRQTNLADWYPMVPAYRRGTGWLVHEPATYGEHMVYDAADFQVTITLIEPARPGEEYQTPVIAASGLAEVVGSTYRYHVPATRNFTWSVSTEYIVTETRAGDTIIQSYIFPEHASFAQDALAYAAEAVDFFSETFSPYPFQSLTIVEGEWDLSMEFAGFYFLSASRFQHYTGTHEEYLAALSVHEVAHSWWYALVGSDQALEPWLDEALCTYSELLFYEARYPQSVEWWWWFRIERYEAVGWVNSTIYDHSEAMSYIQAVYFNGAVFLQALRELVGDEVFFEFLSDYLTNFTHRQATAFDFFALLETHTQENFWRVREEFFGP